jgi:hypothetical protein
MLYALCLQQREEALSDYIAMAVSSKRHTEFEIIVTDELFQSEQVY